MPSTKSFSKCSRNSSPNVLNRLKRKAQTRSSSRRLKVLLTVGLATLFCFTTGNATAWQPSSKSVVSGEKYLKLDSKKVTESSGLAFSGVNEDCVWTHNDSGGKPRLYAFGKKGKASGHVTLEGIKANDWEDMASYVDVVPRLLVADVGDNQTRRDTVSIYLFDEPNPKKKTELGSFQQLIVRYADGPRNCESVAVDLSGRRILLLSKSILFATVHEIPLPARNELSAAVDASGGVVRMNVTAKPVARLALPMATGMDVCPVTGDIWVCSYLHAFRFPAGQDESQELRNTPMDARKVFSQLPQQVDLPKLRQVEAIAVDEQARVWVTSEGGPTLLQRVVH